LQAMEQWGKRRMRKGRMKVRATGGVMAEKDMADEDKPATKSAPKKTIDARQDRLAQALRSNLLKRKENARAKRTMPKGPEEGRQG
ncbi:MAG: hypothetical protein AAF967_10155, partial [Pseudomonadota bacterium]